MHVELKKKIKNKTGVNGNGNSINTNEEYTNTGKEKITLNNVPNNEVIIVMITRANANNQKLWTLM